MLEFIHFCYIYHPSAGYATVIHICTGQNMEKDMLSLVRERVVNTEYWISSYSSGVEDLDEVA